MSRREADEITASQTPQFCPSGAALLGGPLAIALVMIIGLETAATAAFSSLEEHTVVYNGKCPGDRDDDCRD
ncbi:hypothetical protein NON20_03095 [Synechocystis sp. B12]|nr:hypothetical protein NON20_03095 [Synechocystis sp. B12]